MVSASEQPRYRRTPEPLYFPVNAEVPESKGHFELRTFLYGILKLALGDRACIGCDQFVYWDPTDPSACLAPDAFVRLGQRDELFGSWKVWERGAPHVAVEIGSDYDNRHEVWENKLAKYRRLGVQELVRFNVDEAEGPLQVWDGIEGDLVERALIDPRRAQCVPLGLTWVAVGDPVLGLLLRLAHPSTGALLPTGVEQEQAKCRAAEAKSREAGAKFREAEGARDRAVARVRELEQELARLKSST